jgi:hypothetical protein
MESNEQRQRDRGEEKTALADFMGTVCSICGKKKDSGKTFCLSCYYRLPHKMRTALYFRFGSGYEQAFAQAQEWLRENRED